MPEVPQRYIPKSLSKRDTEAVKRGLRKSRALYRKGKYHLRRRVKSFRRRPSKWIRTLRRKYRLKQNVPLDMRLLSKISGCSRKALSKVVSKGKGAYYSSGSRPNQTPTSWGKARLYSVLSGGPASRIDIGILEKGCKKNSKALMLARRAKPIRRSRKVTL